MDIGGGLLRFVIIIIVITNEGKQTTAEDDEARRYIASISILVILGIDQSGHTTRVRRWCSRVWRYYTTQISPWRILWQFNNYADHLLYSLRALCVDCVVLHESVSGRKQQSNIDFVLRCFSDCSGAAYTRSDWGEHFAHKEIKEMTGIERLYDQKPHV